MFEELIDINNNCSKDYDKIIKCDIVADKENLSTNLIDKFIILKSSQISLSKLSESTIEEKI